MADGGLLGPRERGLLRTGGEHAPAVLAPVDVKGAGVGRVLTPAEGLPPPPVGARVRPCGWARCRAAPACRESASSSSRASNSSADRARGRAGWGRSRRSRGAARRGGEDRRDVERLDPESVQVGHERAGAGEPQPVELQPVGGAERRGRRSSCGGARCVAAAASSAR